MCQTLYPEPPILMISVQRVILFLGIASVLFLRILSHNYPTKLLLDIRSKSTPTSNKPQTTSFQNFKINIRLTNELEYQLNITDKCTRTLSIGQANPHPMPARWTDPKLWRYPGQVIDKGRELLQIAMKPFNRLDYIAGLRGIIILCDLHNFNLVLVNIKLLVLMGWKDVIEIYHYHELSDNQVALLHSIPQARVFDLKLNLIFDLKIPYEDGQKWDPVVTGAYARNYQLKPIAMIVSKLQHILFLDGDDFPLFNPDDLFASTEYKSTGLLQWMDIWKISPNNPIFEIFRDKIKCFYDWEIEAGQLLIDKEKHEDTLQLMTRLMLNRFWTSYIFWGDKDLFRISSLLLNKLYYVSPQMFILIGFMVNSEDKQLFCGLGMLHLFNDVPRFFHANQAKHRSGLETHHFSKILYADGPLTNVTGDLPFTKDEKGCTSFGYVAEKNVKYKVINTPENVLQYVKTWLDARIDK
eukprot:NODE_606_length_6171_cov_0.294466.p1 type:complete len:468 gc:universal NODE_606_length_6171_cov_0.294466:2032-629(-)